MVEASAAGPAPAGGYQQRARAALDDMLANFPEEATALGDHRFDDRLDDLSEPGLERTLSVLLHHRQMLAEVAPSALTADDRVDLAMLRNDLDRRIFEIDELGSARWDPLVYNPGEGFYPLLTRDVVPLPDRLRAIAARLEQVPQRLEAAARQLEAPPRAHVETAIARHAGTVAMVKDDIERLLAGEPRMRAVVEPARQRALDALGAFGAVLERLLEGPHRSFRIGATLFEKRLSLALCSPLSPEEVLTRARQRLSEVSSELEEAAGDYLRAAREPPGGNVVQRALDQLANNHPDDPTIVAAAEAALAQCADAVAASGIVTLPDQPMRIELMPVFRRGAGGAYCDAPGPLEEGGETSFAIEPTPDDWGPDEKESFYREYNHAMVVNLTVHEAMPGHMVQLAHARRFRGSTVARQVLASGSFVEGWAVHAERIMAEGGNGGLPVRLQQLKMQLRVAINAILDVSVHAGDMTEESAAELMTRRGHQERSEARGKWRRACLTSSQLSTYFVGYSELAQVFAELDVRGNYDRVLAHGSPPPRLLRELLLAPAPGPEASRDVPQV
ncbi:MAG TPA: DUF885 domain-containing protein [Acidimicrobiales bacterium]|nr:DUF885 domain-containing protein [Acidimicrobiales bacterium]